MNIYVTGCGVATSIGCNTAHFLSNLVEGRANFQPHRQIDAVGPQVPRVAYVNDESLAEGINPRILRKLDRFSLLAIQAFQQAQKEAALNEKAIHPFGILLGNCTGGWTFVEPQMEDIYKGNYDSLSPYVATAWFPTSPQGEISIQNKIYGYSKTFAADSLSAGYALEHAYYLIEQGYLPGAFVGGVEAPLSPLVYNSCFRYKPVSVSGNYLPFHAQADGCLLGEGAGILTIESQEHLQERGAAASVRIAGLKVGSTLIEAIEGCLEQAKKRPQEVQCIFLDAIGSPGADEEEYAALKHCFPSCPNLYLTATKTLYGNLLAADFAVQLVASYLALIHQKIPAGLSSKNNHIKPPVGQLVLDQAVNQPLENILVYARNLDGSSVSVLLEKEASR